METNELLILKNKIENIKDLDTILDEIFAIIDKSKYMEFQDNYNKDILIKDLESKIKNAKSEGEIVNIIDKYLLPKFIDYGIQLLKQPIVNTTPKDEVVNTNTTVNLKDSKISTSTNVSDRTKALGLPENFYNGKTILTHKVINRKGEALETKFTLTERKDKVQYLTNEETGKKEPSIEYFDINFISQKNESSKNSTLILMARIGNIIFNLEDNGKTSTLEQVKDNKDAIDRLNHTLITSSQDITPLDSNKQGDNVVKTQQSEKSPLEGRPKPQKGFKTKIQESNDDITTNPKIDEKVIFINKLISTSKDDKSKDRILTLVNKELERKTMVENEILAELKEIKEKVGIPKEEVIKEYSNDSGKKNTADGKIEFKPKPPRPLETKKFLSLFKNSEYIKFLTHRFNQEKPDYYEFISKCKDEFDIEIKKYPNLPTDFIKRIEMFAFSENPKWFIKKGDKKLFINYGWSEQTFIKWFIDKDNSKHPIDNAKWNAEMINPFKETIEVREGSLQKIVEENIELSIGKERDKFTIIKNDLQLETSEFYTDVDNFSWTIYAILNTIKEKAMKNFNFEIEINFENQQLQSGLFKIFSITHINSESNKSSTDPEFLKGDLSEIKKKLRGLCNYEINAKFADGYKKKIILSDNDKEFKKGIYELEESEVKGFTHILKFY